MKKIILITLSLIMITTPVMATAPELPELDVAVVNPDCGHPVPSNFPEVHYYLQQDPTVSGLHGELLDDGWQMNVYTDYGDGWGYRTYKYWTDGAYTYKCFGFNYLYPLCTPAYTADSDEDGIPDEIDPFPDDRDFTFKTVLIQRDPATGEITFRYIKCTDEDGNVVYVSMGERDENDPYIEVMFDDERSQDAYAALYGTYSDDGGTSTETVEDITGGSSGVEVGPTDPQEAPAVASGSPAGSGDTDSELFQKIVNNTDATADNQEQLAGLLNDANNLKRQQIDMEQQKALQDEKQSSDIVNSARGYGEDGSLSQITGDYSQQEIDGTGLDSDGIENESWFTSFLSGNPIYDAIDNSGVQTSSPVSSMSFTFFGNQIVFDMAPRQSQLNLIGTILLGLAGLAGIIIVVRG